MPSQKNPAVRYPNIERFVRKFGHIEIGTDDTYSAFVRAYDNSSNTWVGKDHYDTLDEALADLEGAMQSYFEDTVEVEDHLIPTDMLPLYEQIVALTDDFCARHLNQEYADLSRELAAGLCQNVTSPISRGKPKTWAAGIVYALGQVNFLSDRSQTPHMPMSELCRLFGVSQQSASTRAREIRELFDLSPLSAPWAIRSVLENTALPWLVMVDGLLADIRETPREVQEQAFRQGLIPYIPADQPANKK